jgi:hypothetical protein
MKYGKKSKSKSYTKKKMLNAYKTYNKKTKKGKK